MKTITNIKEALSRAKNDENVGIAIAHLSGGDEFSLYCAEIGRGKKVGCHYHTQGEEIYIILSGEGVIYTAAVNQLGELGETHSKIVSTGDNFTIRANTAHQLKANTDLLLMFVCPPDHLDEDRVMTSSLVH